ncbi:uncharacterized protein N7484_010258 [Penicillium longicatenatum]|uniref:uncharacterized protein n=1 Tax=Penicillium longicatenatum TaxID=1561947 RepID=UPI002548C685|nr:uncharacterized protein N7484_010258 [Penicillium longicatenatum]KAJ5636945.1 hypothetical protein N7484_010258 [Penicillium longicatenatum]
MRAAELAIPIVNTAPAPALKPAAEPIVAAIMGAPLSLTPKSSSSYVKEKLNINRDRFLTP